MTRPWHWTDLHLDISRFPRMMSKMRGTRICQLCKICLCQLRILSLCLNGCTFTHLTFLLYHFHLLFQPLLFLSYPPPPILLTAEVEVDAGGNLSVLVLGFHFIKSSVGLNYIIQFQYHRVLVLPVLDHLDARPVIVHDADVLTEPNHLWLWTSGQLAFEYEPVSIVLLPELWLLDKAWGHVVPYRPHDDASKLRSFLLLPLLGFPLRKPSGSLSL